MPEQTWQPAEGVATDTYIDENNPAVNYGANIDLVIGWNAGGDNRDIFMRWDLSSIPTGSTIEIATLYLWCENRNAIITDAHITRVLPANAAWTEGGCTWNTMDGVNAWTGGAGCEVVGTDLALTHIWTGDLSLMGAAAAWWTFDLSVSEFQFLLDVGNYGFKIWSTTRAPGFDAVDRFTSASGVNAAHWPQLYVRWLEPSGRLVEYTFDVWDPLQRLIGRDGHEVQPNEVRADRWGKLLGFRSPSSKTYASLADGPDHFYISGVTSDGETVRIIPDEKLFADMILKRITR